MGTRRALRHFGGMVIRPIPRANDVVSIGVTVLTMVGVTFLPAAIDPPWMVAGFLLGALGFIGWAGYRLQVEHDREHEVTLTIEYDETLSKEWISKAPSRKRRKQLDSIAKDTWSKTRYEKFRREGTMWYSRCDLLRITNTASVAARNVRVQIQDTRPLELTQETAKFMLPKEIRGDPMRWEPLPLRLKWWHSKSPTCDIPAGQYAWVVVRRHFKSRLFEAFDTTLHLGEAYHVVAWCDGGPPAHAVFAMRDPAESTEVDQPDPDTSSDQK